MVVTPIQDRVLVRLADRETQTASGLALVQAGPHLPTEGTVVAVGPRVKEVKRGDRVGFYEGHGHSLTLDGVPHRVLEEHMLLGVVDG